MRDGASLTTAPPATRRRSAVGAKWAGLYERVNRLGERVLEFDYYDESGRRRWHTMPVGSTLKQVQATREDYRGKRRRGERFAPAVVPTIADSWETWLDEAAVALRPRTVIAYRAAFARIVPRLGRLRVSAVDRQDVLGFVRALQRDGLAAWTIRGTLVPLGLFFAWAEDRGWRSGNPVRELRRNERPRVVRKQHRNLTGGDLWRLVEAADEERKAFVALLSFAGLRLSECLGLAWQDVDLDGRVLHVRFQLERGSLVRVPPKTARAVRSIEMGDGLVSVLRAWKLRSAHSKPGDFVVTTRAGSPLDHHGAGRRLETVVKRAGLDVEGLPKITPHQLRYAFGSLLVEAGESISVVSRLMGHTNEAVTLGIYVHEVERRDGGERTRLAMAQAFDAPSASGTSTLGRSVARPLPHAHRRA
jgi:integrase